jgi:hypothetical protein
MLENRPVYVPPIAEHEPEPLPRTQYALDGTVKQAVRAEEIEALRKMPLEQLKKQVAMETSLSRHHLDRRGIKL